LLSVLTIPLHLLIGFDHENPTNRTQKWSELISRRKSGQN
jgi:hypothetical protein